ncbi:MAG: ribonuclease Y [Candidatus Methylomirabilales bacterium]
MEITGGSWLIVIGVAIVSLAVGFVARSILARYRIAGAEERARAIVADAGKEGERRRKEAELELKDMIFRAKADLENEARERRGELQGLERRLLQREESLERKLDLLDRREQHIGGKETELDRREESLRDSERKVQALLAEERQNLERISGMTAEEAKRVLIRHMEGEARLEAMALIRRVEDEAKETADRKAKEILAIAIDRCASDFVAEATVSVVDLPSDDMKGRIIGREGRNIRAFEKATGIDVIVDDTPEAVILSGFDSVRREVARIAMERLIVDGRIHPARIEEVVEKVKKEIDEKIREAGEQVTFELGVTGLHAELVRLIGRLRYRTSYSQNQLHHTREVAQLAAMVATEMGLDPALVKRAALLHDIGKSVDGYHEGTHTQIAAEFAKKYGEHPHVVNAIAAHHEDEEPNCLEAIILQAADSLSAARPGARREILESYVKRLEKLEKIADSFKGVSKSYAVQAGREIRIIVESGHVTDTDAQQMARDIARRIEQELEYPGHVKVTVIRETRAVEYAK